MAPSEPLEEMPKSINHRDMLSDLRGYDRQPTFRHTRNVNMNVHQSRELGHDTVRYDVYVGEVTEQAPYNARIGFSGDAQSNELHGLRTIFDSHVHRTPY